ncbi:hypothetical protein [Corynebacterium sp. HMSC071B10]|uniref:hypothetical protein n=1 Tax=Corynebacterium sp. HMSC071B10 TaxID=1739494 RepID=UPI0008A2555D|nr:hypothetical protein [Corynebacterium sp. HMSC071B10]OFP37861.1 hypothetical protein HMPREF2990_02490 [Corynebacterium sp. HMSC071B10]
MKRIASATLAATTALTMTAAPAYAADDVPSSSKFYSECVNDLRENDKEARKQGYTNKEIRDAYREETKGEFAVPASSASGYCLGLMTNDDYEGEHYKDGTIAFLTFVPLGIVALLGVAAAASGVIPGVSLPAVPGLPR